MSVKLKFEEFRLYILTALLIVTSLAGAASATAAISMNSLELGTGLRVERETDGVTLDGQHTLTVAVGLNVYTDWVVLAEFSTFSDSREESILSVKRNHYEVFGWGKFSFLTHQSFDLQIGGGLGLFWETIETKVGSLSDVSGSNPEILLGGMLGGEYRFSPKVAFGMDLHLIGNTNNSIGPVFDAMARLKYLF